MLAAPHSSGIIARKLSPYALTVEHLKIIEEIVNRLKFVACIILFSCCLNANAAGSSGVVSLEEARIQLISNDTARVYIYDIPIDDGCDKQIPVLLFEGENANSLAGEIYSTLLLAKASAKKVIIQTTGCWSELSTPIITSMYLHN